MAQSSLAKESEDFSIKRQNYRTIGLFILTLIYLLIGTVTFENLESSREESSRKVLLDAIEKFRERYPMSDEKFEEFYEHLLNRSVLKSNLQWDFYGSFFFCMITITLIGYGNNTPQTDIGRKVLMMYLPLGTVFSLISLQSVGKQFNEFLRYQLGHRRLFGNLKIETVTNIHIVVIECILTTILILTASFIFSFNEGWAYFDSIYYSFITVTTIGFGDFVPLQNGVYQLYYFGFTLIFITTGLVMVASAINLLVVYLANINKNSMESLKRRMEQKKQMELRVIGDVINFKNNDDKVSIKSEKITNHFDDPANHLCAVHLNCIDFSKFKIKPSKLFKSNFTLRSQSFPRYKVRQQPSSNIIHLSQSKDRLDFILPSEEKRILIQLQNLAIMGDFIKYRTISRRNSH